MQLTGVDSSGAVHAAWRVHDKLSVLISYLVDIGYNRSFDLKLFIGYAGGLEQIIGIPVLCFKEFMLKYR